MAFFFFCSAAIHETHRKDNESIYHTHNRNELPHNKNLLRNSYYSAFEMWQRMKKKQKENGMEKSEKKRKENTEDEDGDETEDEEETSNKMTCCVREHIMK